MLSVYPHIELIAAFADGAALVAGMETQLPDVLLLDIHLPDKTGDALTPLLLKKHPGLKILALTNIDSTLYVHNMLRLGAMGYLLKNTDPSMVIQAIETVHKGAQFIDPSLSNKLAQFTSRAKKGASMKPSLTVREKEILQLTVHGDTIQEISSKLFIGLRTVEYYRSNLFLKLDVKNMASLIRKTIELGILEEW